MADWHERMRQIQEQENRKIVANKARVEAEVRDKLQQQQSADQRKNDERAAGFNKGRELAKVLERIKVKEMLREIRQQVWGNLGEIRDSYSTDFNRGTETTGLYWDFEIDKLIRKKYVTHKAWSLGPSGDSGSTRWGSQDIQVAISLRRTREQKTSALIVYAYTELPDRYIYSQFPGKTRLYVGDHFGLGDIDGSSGSLNINDYGYGTLVLGDGATDSQVQAFIEDSFAKSCLYRAKNKLLPFQLKDRVSEIHSAQEIEVQQNRKLLRHKR